MPAQKRTSPAIPIFAAVAVAACVAVSATSTFAEELPFEAGGKEVITSAITPKGDVDSYRLFLVAGDLLTVKVKDAGPDRGLYTTLALDDPSGSDIDLDVAKQGASRPSFKYTAADSGYHVLHLSGDPGGFAGSDGDYVVTLTVKRGKPAKQTFATEAGGSIAFAFGAEPGARVTLAAKTKKGGFDLTGLRAPGGGLESGFTGALKTKSNRRVAKVRNLQLQGGAGTYTLEGAYDAGSAVVVKATVIHADRRRKRELSGDEPGFDALVTPFPDRGISPDPTKGLLGTLMTVVGRNFVFDPGEVDDEGNNVTTADDLQPRFLLGGIEIPVGDVTVLGGQVRFRVPAGLTVDEKHDLDVINPDGQGSRFVDAFYVVPPPRLLGLSANTAGPAGGRAIELQGADFREGAVALVGTTVVQPALVRSSHVDIVVPPHDPGTFDVSVRDVYGQTSTLSNSLSYLDRGSNRIDSIDLEWLQGVGGQTVTVTGADFASDSVLTFDGQDVGATRVSATTMTFVAPPHAGGTYAVRVIDSVFQSSSLDVAVRAFTDDTTAAVPAPRTVADSADGWRATTILSGDLNGNGLTDLVLLRPEAAFGGDVNRSRIRVLLGDGAGGFTDDTENAIPANAGDEDGRAESGVLIDLNDDQAPDLAIITREAIDGGARSSLRIYMNDGTGVFTDATSSSVPASTTYGDRNQGLAIAAADMNDDDIPDLVILNDEAFMEVIVTPPPPPPVGEEPGPDTIETFYYPGLRVLLNDGDGVFTRRSGALPSYDANRGHDFEGDALAVADVNHNGYPDVLITRDDALVDPADSSAHLLTAVLLDNDGTATLTDVSSARLPSAGDPEYLQADHAMLTDLDGDQIPDLVLSSDVRIVSPQTGQLSSLSAMRVFMNNGNGTFAPPASNPMPSALDSDNQQCRAFAVGDLTGDGAMELVLISTNAPNVGQRGLRVLVDVGGAFQRGTAGLPSTLAGDDLRGAAVILLDVDRDGDLDIVSARSEADETVRNLRVLLNPLDPLIP